MKKTKLFILCAALGASLVGAANAYAQDDVDKWLARYDACNRGCQG